MVFNFIDDNYDDDIPELVASDEEDEIYFDLDANSLYRIPDENDDIPILMEEDD